ncbi:unnamed protein product [Darwinula stevensoni]|uniref:DH domain-containing protein n=1 Tax=Darwinula stevensoni TaxID=69355 RepID=A0A7R9AE60_9CRUS|nr:unnamed protein product [Darwinula stevensoni]CAG0901688.1 unnamed protein product [Darwinula stevensoni]
MYDALVAKVSRSDSGVGDVDESTSQECSPSEESGSDQRDSVISDDSSGTGSGTGCSSSSSSQSSSSKGAPLVTSAPMVSKKVARSESCYTKPPAEGDGTGKVLSNSSSLSHSLSQCGGDLRPLSLTSTSSSSSSSSSFTSHHHHRQARPSASVRSSAYLASIESLATPPPDLTEDEDEDDEENPQGKTHGQRNSWNPSTSFAPPYYCDPNLSYLDRIIMEIIDTERVYVKDLQEVISGYVDVMKNNEAVPIPQEEISVLFGNLEDIYNFNKELLRDLEAAGMDVAQVASCFMESNSGFAIYSHYCNNYPKSVSLLTELLRREEVASYFRTMQSSLHHTLPLGSYLLKPVQRILKYHLLLQNLAKHINEELDGYNILVNALSAMTGIAHHINEMKRKHEHAVRVQEIQSLLYGWPGEDLTQYGELCSNLMLIESIANEPYSFHLIPFDNPRMQFTLQARSLEQKREWTLQIKRAILENYEAVIPTHARDLVLQLGQDKKHEEPVGSKRVKRKQHSAPEYLDRLRSERQSSSVKGRRKSDNLLSHSASRRQNAKPNMFARQGFEETRDMSWRVSTRRSMVTLSAVGRTMSRRLIQNIKEVTERQGNGHVSRDSDVSTPDNPKKSEDEEDDEESSACETNVDDMEDSTPEFEQSKDSEISRTLETSTEDSCRDKSVASIVEQLLMQNQEIRLMMRKRLSKGSPRKVGLRFHSAKNTPVLCRQMSEITSEEMKKLHEETGTSGDEDDAPRPFVRSHSLGSAKFKVFQNSLNEWKQRKGEAQGFNLEKRHPSENALRQTESSESKAEEAPLRRTNSFSSCEKEKSPARDLYLKAEQSVREVNGSSSSLSRSSIGESVRQLFTRRLGKEKEKEWQSSSTLTESINGKIGPSRDRSDFSIHPENRLYRPQVSRQSLRKIMTSISSKLSGLRSNLNGSNDNLGSLNSSMDNQSISSSEGERQTSRIIQTMARQYHLVLKERISQLFDEKDSSSGSSQKHSLERTNSALGERLANPYNSTDYAVPRLLKHCHSEPIHIGSLESLDSVLSSEWTDKNSCLDERSLTLQSNSSQEPSLHKVPSFADDLSSGSDSDFTPEGCYEQSLDALEILDSGPLRDSAVYSDIEDGSASSHTGTLSRQSSQRKEKKTIVRPKQPPPPIPCKKPASISPIVSPAKKASASILSKLMILEETSRFCKAESLSASLENIKSIGERRRELELWTSGTGMVREDESETSSQHSTSTINTIVENSTTQNASPPLSPESNSKSWVRHVITKLQGSTKED